VKKKCPRGFTVLEILIGLLLIALLLVVAIPTFRSLARVQLKETANQMLGLIRYTYSKATLSNKGHRIVFDMDAGQYWVEVSNDQVRISQEDEDSDEGGQLGIFQSEDKGRKYARPPSFVPDEGEFGTKQKLPSGIRFWGFWADYMKDRARSGEVALYFFPDGYTQEAQITLTDDDGGDHVLTLLVEPLTGEVIIENSEPEIEK
jgi:general secretion pathway protein H